MVNKQSALRNRGTGTSRPSDLCAKQNLVYFSFEGTLKMSADDPEVSIHTEPSTPLRSSLQIEISAQYSAPIPARLPKTDLTRVFRRLNSTNNNKNDNDNNSNNNSGNNNNEHSEQTTPGRRLERRRSRTPKTIHAKNALDRSPYFSPNDSRRRAGIRTLLTPVRYNLRRKRRRSLISGNVEYTVNYVGPVTIDFLRVFCRKLIEEKGQESSKKVKTTSSPSTKIPIGDTKSPSEFDYSLPLPKSNLQSPQQNPFTEIEADELNPYLDDDSKMYEVLSPIPLYQLDAEQIAPVGPAPSGRPISYLERILAAQAKKTRSSMEKDENGIQEQTEKREEINTVEVEEGLSVGDEPLRSPKTPANHSVSDLVIEELTIGTSKLDKGENNMTLEGGLNSVDEGATKVEELGDTLVATNDIVEEIIGEAEGSTEPVQADVRDQFLPNDWQNEDDLDIPLIGELIEADEQVGSSPVEENDVGDEDDDDDEDSGLLKDQYILEEEEPLNLDEEQLEGQPQTTTNLVSQTRVASSFALESRKTSSSIPVNLVKNVMKTVVKNCSLDSQLPVKSIGREATTVLQDISDSFLENMASDLEAYSLHRTNGRSHQINMKDMLLLLELSGQIPGKRNRLDQINVISKMAHDSLPLELLVGLKKSLTQTIPLVESNSDSEDDR